MRGTARGGQLRTPTQAAPQSSASEQSQFPVSTLAASMGNGSEPLQPDGNASAPGTSSNPAASKGSGLGLTRRSEAVTASDARTTTDSGSEPLFQKPLRPGGLGTCRCRGRIVKLAATYGWIMPLDAIEHPDLHRHAGLIWFSLRDVRLGTPLAPGIELTFDLYADIDGLGAEDCHVAPAWSHTSLTRFSQHTPLTAAAKAFIPGAVWSSCRAQNYAPLDYQHRRPSVLTDSFVLNAVQIASDDEDTGASVGEERAEPADEMKRGFATPTSTGTGGCSSDSESTQEKQPDADKTGGSVPPPGFLPPPGLPPPPGLAPTPSAYDCSCASSSQF